MPLQLLKAGSALAVARKSASTAMAARKRCFLFIIGINVSRHVYKDFLKKRISYCLLFPARFLYA